MITAEEAAGGGPGEDGAWPGTVVTGAVVEVAGVVVVVVFALVDVVDGVDVEVVFALVDVVVAGFTPSVV